MTPDPPNPGRDGRSDAHLWARHAGLGVQFALTIVAFTLLGGWLDGKLGTSPWLLLVGLLLAFVGGTISLVHRVPPPTRPAREQRGAARDGNEKPPTAPGPTDTP